MFGIFARHGRGPALAVSAVLAAVLTGSMPVLAQTPQSPAPTGTPPAPTDSPAPGGVPIPPPGGPAPDVAARARAAAVAAKANVDIGEAWTRATTGNATTAPVFLTITSNKDPDRLIGIDVAISESASIEDAVRQNGAVKLTPAETLEIPAGATIDFKPGGRQLTLAGLREPLKEGDSFLVTLKFDKAGSESMAVKVLSPTATGLPPVGSTRKGDSTAAVSPR